MRGLLFEGGRLIEEIWYIFIDIDKSEWLEDIKHGDSSSASLMACVEECISERESRKFEEGLNAKVKLDIYERFGKSVKFKGGLTCSNSIFIFLHNNDLLNV